MKRITQHVTACLLALSLTVLSGCNFAAPAPNEQPAGATGAVAGKQAPDFTLQTMSGQPVTLSELRGQNVFLNFWASWCDPCRAEMPDLKEVARAHEPHVLTYGINLTDEDDRERAQQFILELGLTFPNLFDTNGDIKKAYRILSIPTSFTINEQGIIVERRDGQLTREAMEAMYRRLVNES